METIKTRLYLLPIVLVGLALFACQEDKLVFPVQIEEVEPEHDAILAGPSNAEVLGTYDLKFKIQWNGVSDRVAKAIITYTEAGAEKQIEVTDFAEDYYLQTDEVAEYTFALQFIGKDGTPSKVVKRMATNRTYLVEYLVDHFELSKMFNRMRIIWENESNTAISVHVEYVHDGNTYKLNVENSTDPQDTLETVAMRAGEIEFNIAFYDEAGRTGVKDTSFTLLDTEYVTAADKSNWIITASNQHSEGLGANNLIDGIVDGDNHWHTNWYPDSSNPETIFPHEVEITLAEPIVLDGITLHNRTGGSNDGVKTFDVLAKEKVEDEYEKVASGLEQVMEKGAMGSFTIQPTKPIKMIKLVFKDGWPRNGIPEQYAHLAEIDVKGMTE